MLHGHLGKKRQLKKADGAADFWEKRLNFINRFAEILSAVIVHLTLIALLIIAAMQLILSKWGIV